MHIIHTHVVCVAQRLLDPLASRVFEGLRFDWLTDWLTEVQFWKSQAVCHAIGLNASRPGGHQVSTNRGRYWQEETVKVKNSVVGHIMVSLNISREVRWMLHCVFFQHLPFLVLIFFCLFLQNVKCQRVFLWVMLIFRKNAFSHRKTRFLGYISAIKKKKKRSLNVSARPKWTWRKKWWNKKEFELGNTKEKKCFWLECDKAGQNVHLANIKYYQQ